MQGPYPIIREAAGEPLVEPVAERIRLPLTLLVGTLLTALNVYILMYMEIATNSGVAGTGGGPYPSTISLFANAILFLVVVTIVNNRLARVLPRYALRRAELIVVYVMLVIATSIVSIDFMDVLVPMMTYPFRMATPENKWATTILPHIPSWASVSDPEAVKGWYAGDGNLYVWSTLKWWLVPAAVWSGVIFVMLFVMFCINTLVRQQWIEHDKLQFPIVELPMQITEPGGRLLKSRLMWMGFALSGSICLMNGLSFLYPQVPYLNVRMWDASPYFINKPWNAIGWTPISFYPYAIGLGFLLPLDMLFSCWFFFIMWRVIRILGAVYGAYEATPNFPFMNQQALGAYYLVGVFALWSGRHHLKHVFEAAFAGKTDRDERSGPMSYRVAAFGLIIGTAIVVVFFRFLGLRPWIAIAGIGMYFFLALAIARMHAEFGPPSHDLHYMGPEMVLMGLFGAGAFAPRELVGLSWFWWFNRAYRSIPIAYQLDGLKLAQRSCAPMRQMSIAMAVASVCAVICGFCYYLHFGYDRGAAAGMAGHVTWFGWEAFGLHANNWLLSPPKPDYLSTLAIGWGMAFTFFLYMMKLKVGWWCFHPLGFAVSTSYSIGTLWLPILIAWLAKFVTLRTGGMRAYRTALDFFLGLLLGDFIVGCSWPIIGWILKQSTYSYMQ